MMKKNYSERVKQLVILKNLEVGLITYPMLQSHQEKNYHMEEAL